MTKLIVFDLDGVLVEAKQIHYDTLNQALKEVGEQYVISEAEHLSTYDGLKTTQKLEMLTQNKRLQPEFYDKIWLRKQHLTIEAISELKPDLQKIELFKELRNMGYKLACASNSIRRSVLVMLLNENKGMSIPKWQGGKMNVLIPMAGAGSRFAQAGYTFPKPLIDVEGKPMIQVVVDNLNIDATFIYVVQKSHREQYNLDTLLNLITPNCKIVEVDGLTEGAACTTLLAKEYIDSDAPLLMANSDQFLEWDSNEFMYKMVEQKVDGGILSFTSTHPKWSFAKVDEYGYVTEVAEKNPISDIATVGVYYWANGSDYVKYAEQMIEKNIRVNNEFYVCPVYNEAIGNGKKIKTFNIEKMWGLGTPEDLNYYLENYKND